MNVPKFLSILLMLAAAARGQTTKPVAVWFQPLANLPLMADLNITHAFGPELENPPKTTLAGWSAKAESLGLKVVLKLPANFTGLLPPNCVGLLISVDEPNGKGVPPATIKAEYDRLKAAYPNQTIFLSLAGDKITSANFAKPAELKLYQDYLAACDVATINVYSFNRNAARYKATWTADCVRKLKTISEKPVWAWIECSDQKLKPAPKPEDGFARGPTALEMKATVAGAMDADAGGIGWFATASSGWAGWPQSFWTGVVNPEQQEAVKEISLSVAGPRAPPTTQPVTNADLQQQLNRIEAKLDKLVETVVPVFNGVVFGRDKANADPILKPFTWLPSEHWRNEKKADWWVAAKDYWGAVNKPADPNHDPLYSQRLRLAGRIAAQTGAPVNLDHELAGGNYTAEQIGWIAEHVRIFRGGAGVPIQVGVYDVWAMGRPVQTNQEAANPTPATEQRVKAAIEAAAPLWKEVDYILIDAYLWETDAAGEELTIRCHSNMVRWIKAHSGKPVWIYVAGIKKTGNNTYGGIVSADLAKRHVKALVEAGADALVLFGAYDDAAGYLAAVKK